MANNLEEKVRGGGSGNAIAGTPRPTNNNTAVNYNINYNDPRFTQVEKDKNQALSNLDKTYSGMIGDTDKFYQAQIDASKQWADTQSKNQQAQTDFAIEKIEQEKDLAQKDYLREQSGAYVDWKKQSNEYGVNAEEMASGGLAETGFSESSQVSMYNTYQNRIATARETFNRALMNYNNSINEARLQNNAALAEIALNAFKEQAQYALEGFQYKNNLILEQTNKKIEVDQIYHNRYQDVLAQINHEKSMAEQIRQFNQNYNLQVKQYEEGIRQFNEEIARLKAQDAKENEMAIKELELKKQQLEEEKRQFNETMSYNKSKSSGGGSNGGTVRRVTGGSTHTAKVVNKKVPKDTSEVVGKHNVVSGRVAEALAMYEVNKAKKVFFDAITGR